MVNKKLEDVSSVSLLKKRMRTWQRRGCHGGRGAQMGENRGDIYARQEMIRQDPRSEGEFQVALGRAAELTASP